MVPQAMASIAQASMLSAAVAERCASRAMISGNTRKLEVTATYCSALMITTDSGGTSAGMYWMATGVRDIGRPWLAAWSGIGERTDCPVVVYCVAVSRALSRRSNFWIFPVEVFGSGPNTT